MEKGIDLYYEDGYYGNNVVIWSVKGKGMIREEFLKAFMYCLIEFNWFRSNIDMKEALDFYDTLKNSFSGDELYNNFIINICWIEEFDRKVSELGLYDKYKKVVYNKQNKAYGDHETISLFGKFTPYLKKNEDFKEWFINELLVKDKELYYSITDESGSKESLLNYKKQLLEQAKKDVEYYEKEYNARKEKHEKILSEIKELENK